MRVHVLSSRTGRSARLLSDIIDIASVKSEIEIYSYKAEDIVVSMGFMRKIGKELYKKCEVINVHPGPLGELPGRHPQIRALADLERKSTQVVLHRVQSDEYDVGEIIYKADVVIQESDRDDPNAFMERTRQIGVHLTAAYLIGRGARLRT